MPTAVMALEWRAENHEFAEWPALEPPVNWEKSEEPTASPVLAGTDCVSLSDLEEPWATEIKRAEVLTELGPDWDGEGSEAIARSTFDRAASFLTMYGRYLWQSNAIRLPVPSIGPGPQGSIDIHWKLPAWELLINIPKDEREMAAFYGDNYGSQRIKGSVSPSIFNPGIAQWLMA